MNLPTCPTCHKPGVQQRESRKTGRPYLANVETYPSGVSYFRSLHTREQCEAYAAAFTAAVDAQVRFDAAMTEWRAEGHRLAEDLRHLLATGADYATASGPYLAHCDAMPVLADFTA